ncbi:MAG: DUF3052 family protein [Actinomycetota bacterium]|nr:MAG: DUF3052 family protein [Actinomycetota bacterium]
MTSSAGYSGTPLPAKLGIRPGSRVLLDGAPPQLAADLLVPLPDAVTIHRRAGRSPYDVVVAFRRTRADLVRGLTADVKRITTSGAVWVAWPKRASGVATDLTEDVIRDVALPLGVVDVKVCAIDATWSGLKLVWRKENRPA